MAETSTTTTTNTDTTTTTVADNKDDAKARSNTTNGETDAAGNSADNTHNPSREESLKEAGKASPHAPDAGLKDGTQVLGAEGQSSAERMDDARREGLQNAAAEREQHA